MTDTASHSAVDDSRTLPSSAAMRVVEHADDVPAHITTHTLVHAAAQETATRLADGQFDLIYIDPPFNTGSTRTSATTAQRSGSQYADSFGGDMAAYARFLAEHARQFRRLLSDSGTLYIHLDWRAAHYVKVAVDDIFGRDNFLNEICWHYRTGGVSKRWFGRKHDTILVYARNSGQHTFNPIRQGQYRTDGLRYDKDGRPYKSTRNGPVYFDPDGPLLADVWDVPFLSTVSRERTGYPTQKPEALLDRIVRASSNAGDMVGDFFCGSGTTLSVAARLGRRCFGVDVHKRAIELTAQRLSGIGNTHTSTTVE